MCVIRNSFLVESSGSNMQWRRNFSRKTRSRRRSERFSWKRASSTPPGPHNLNRKVHVWG